MRNPLRSIRGRIRRELQIGGLAAVRQDDRRILPWITVDPLLIDRRHSTFRDRRAPLFRHDLRFESDWIPIEVVDTFDVRPRFYQEVFAEGRTLRETTEFRYHLDMIARDGATWHRITTEDGVLRYLEGKVRMFEDIRRAGEIRPNLEISGRRRDEIGCLIDHRGRLIKGKSGNNRFAIARMLRIHSVPVQIDAIHIGQIPAVNRLPGVTPIARINRYLLSVQEDHAHRPSPDPTQASADGGEGADGSRARRVG